MKRTRAFITVMLLCICSTALAQKPAFVSGGVGEDQLQALERARADYPLGLTFSQGSRGEWLAGVKVSITDKSGTSVLQGVSEGPLMLVNLPPGEYTVTAEVNGRALKREAKVGAAGHTRLSFNWPQAQG